MDASKVIKQLMQERGISIADMAKLLGLAQQTISNKLYRNTWTVKDLCHIADLLNADVKIVTRDTKKEFY